MVASQNPTGSLLPSLSPSGKAHNFRRPPKPSSPSAPASSSNHFNRANSPTRISLRSSPDSVPSVQFNSAVGAGNDQVLRRQSHHHQQDQKRTCMCSPTTHPGSFRCSLHKSLGSRLQPTAMTNSLVRIHRVEDDDLMRRAPVPMIRQSPRQKRRRGEFRPQPSRLSVMSTAAA